MTAVTCSACGATVTPGAWYCLTCGSPHAAPPPPAPAGGRNAAILVALVGMAVLGALAGVWIERQRSDPAPAPVTVPTIVTQTVTTPPPPPATTAVAAAPTPVARGGRATRLPR